jgi:transposase
MASLQRSTSHGQSYWRVVESYRRADGRPAVRTLAHLGKPDDLLARLRAAERIEVQSVAAGAVDAVWALGQELGVAAAIDAALAAAGATPRQRDGLTVGASLLVAAVARLCHPSSKRAIADWAATTTLPVRAGVPAAALTSQHFWDQMDVVPVAAVAAAEEAIVARALTVAPVTGGVLAYDTTNFYTHLATANTRSQLAQRGHNKQRRHDLRQLGLALVVAADGELPLGHVLYEGARPDARTWAGVLAPLRGRLHRLLAEPTQLTFVFDQGAETAENLAAIRATADGYVTALKPSAHRRWLATIRDRLAPVVLSAGETVDAYRTRRAVHGVEQTVVVVSSPRLAEGQRRGLAQHLAQALAAIARLRPHPRGGVAGAQARVRRICDRQYVREILHVAVTAREGQVDLHPVIDAARRAALEARYFGLRVLATTQDTWSTAAIIEAYRGQARVERAFRDLKDPWVAAFRPQYHWTDQKLVVHALIAVLGLLLGRVLLHRARRAGFVGTLRGLIQHLGQIRLATIVHRPAHAGRPRVRRQLEAGDPALGSLATALGLEAPAPTARVYTTPRR